MLSNFWHQKFFFFAEKCPAFEKKFGVNSMKESSKKAMEPNNEARLNVDDQQDDKTFKVKSDICD